MKIVVEVPDDSKAIVVLHSLDENGYFTESDSYLKDELQSMRVKEPEIKEHTVKDFRELYKSKRAGI